MSPGGAGALGGVALEHAYGGTTAKAALSQVRGVCAVGRGGAWWQAGATAVARAVLRLAKDPCVVLLLWVLLLCPDDARTT